MAQEASGVLVRPGQRHGVGHSDELGSYKPLLPPLAASVVHDGLPGTQEGTWRSSGTAPVVDQGHPFHTRASLARHFDNRRAWCVLPRVAWRHLGMTQARWVSQT